MSTEYYKVLQDETLEHGHADYQSEEWHIPKKTEQWQRKNSGITVSLTNGATAPSSTPAKVQVYVGITTSAYVKHGGPISGSLDNGGSVSVPVDIPTWVNHVKCISAPGNDQDVDVYIEGNCAV